MRKNFKSGRTTKNIAFGKKIACMAAIATTMFAFTACGDEKTPEEQFMEDINNAVEDMSDVMTGEITTTEPQAQLPSYTYESGVLTINADIILTAGELRDEGINVEDVTEVIFDGASTIAKDCSRFSNLTKVTMGECVTTIDDNAFSNCNKLETVIMTDNVTLIGSNAFRACESLVNIELSDNLTDIGNNAFHDCTSLIAIHIPASVKNISQQVFESCRSLETITLEEGLEIISNAAFAGVPASEINIPSTVKYIGEYSLSSCPNLASVVFPDGIERLSKGVLAGCPNLTSVTIPDSVTFIYENPIGENESLTIYGKTGSLAEKFASDYGFTFVEQSR